MLYVPSYRETKEVKTDEWELEKEEIKWTNSNDSFYSVNNIRPNIHSFQCANKKTFTSLSCSIMWRIRRKKSKIREIGVFKR